ncbi:MAG TPA: NAD(P)-binding domain-containing protein [Candidatus Baltobacteraceae bacterium]|nr:NAD(P)-binding domain-containing protein [Candidatus Baltobacteraceae bacterium]
MKLAVIGDPVDHSRSPEIHRALLREAEIDGTYVAIHVPKINAINVVRRMRLDEYTGANVTFPLKEEVMTACDVLTEEARRAQAVNTILFGREILGHNTDGIGARIALETILEDSISLKRIAILGTGATARAILAQLQENDAYTFVWGRDEAKVAAACERFDARAFPYDNPPEIVISTLPPKIRFEPEMLAALMQAEIVMDVNYGRRATLHHQLEREIVNGDAMLLAQAQASFDFWLAHLDGVAPA